MYKKIIEKYPALEKYIVNNHKPVVILGNAWNLKHIDYSKVPKDAYITRMNHFYFETQYYMGKHVDFHFTANFLPSYKVFSQMTLDCISQNIYTIDNWVYINPTNTFQLKKTTKAGILDVLAIIQQTTNTEIARLFSGIYGDTACYPKSLSMLPIVLLFFLTLGFKDFYFGGITFFQSSSISEQWYEFEAGSNLKKFSTSIGLSLNTPGIHDNFYEMDFFTKIEKITGANFYDLIDHNLDYGQKRVLFQPPTLTNQLFFQKHPKPKNAPTDIAPYHLVYTPHPQKQRIKIKLKEQVKKISIVMVVFYSFYYIYILIFKRNKK